MRVSLLIFSAIFSSAIFSSAALAQQERQVSFGANYNVGWGGETTSADTSNDIDNYDITETDLNLNYLHTVAPRVQLGASFTYANNSTEIDYDTAGNVESTIQSTSLYAIGVYNFADEFKNAYYAGISVGKDFVNQEVGDEDSDYDVDGMLVFAGKRMDLEFLGISNLTYAPSLGLAYKSVNGDLEDAGVDSLMSLRWDLIKLDLLF